MNLGTHFCRASCWAELNTGLLVIQMHLVSALQHGADNPHIMCADPPCMHIAQVELPWRALLPPGVDDLVLAIHDDEPTSIVAYFLATR